MTIDDLKRQRRGAHAIAAEDPLDLNTTAPNDSLPGILERRTYITRLAERLLPRPLDRILEGVFLGKSRRQIALVLDVDGSAWAIGDGLKPTAVPFPSASAWRRMACAIGKRERDGSQ